VPRQNYLSGWGPPATDGNFAAREGECTEEGNKNVARN